MDALPFHEVTRVIPPIDVDAQFRFNESHAVILDKSDLTSVSFQDSIRNAVFNTDSDVSFVARCKCESRKGNALIGTICPICHTPVSFKWDTAQDYLRSDHWVQAPDLLPGGWLQPAVWATLSTWLDISGKGSWLDYVLDTTLDLPVEFDGYIEGQGFAYLYHNFDKVISFFSTVFAPTKDRELTPFVLRYLQVYKDQLWCHYHSLPSRDLHPIMTRDSSDTTKRYFSDQKATNIINAIVTLSRARHLPQRRRTLERIEKMAYKAYRYLMAYDESLEDITVGGKTTIGKKATPRAHISGGRLNLTCRTVITPIVGPHDYDEIRMPWKLVVSNKRVEILSKLTNKHGMSPNQAIAVYTSAELSYHPLVHEIIKELIDEHPYKAFPIVWWRPPTIQTMTLLMCREVKTDMNDDTASSSSFFAKLSNEDYDGDNKLGLFILESRMVDALMPLHPAYLLLNKNSPGISPELGVHSDVYCTFNRAVGVFD